MKKVLVAVGDYINPKGKYAHQFVHVRNLYYIQCGIDVTVLNFKAKECYIIEGVHVITYSEFKKRKFDYDILICHQPNLKNHYLFLKKYGNLFAQFIFFFHGHEVLKINYVYPEPYEYMKKNWLEQNARNIYDDFKLFVWRNYYPKYINKSSYVFVSRWMLDEFLKWTKIKYSTIKYKTFITYNSIGKCFENYKYRFEATKEFDFITIRNNLDGSKYCIDLINEYANENPKLKFLVIGRGQYFKHYEKAANITWINKAMNHEEIIDNIDKARCGLMLTRTDAQGLMTCEMAATGIPIITSDIPVCHEIFDGMRNIIMIKNGEKVDLEEMLKHMETGCSYNVDERYYQKNTAAKEVELIRGLYKSNRKDRGYLHGIKDKQKKNNR